MQVPQRRGRLGHGIECDLAQCFPLTSERLDKMSARLLYFIHDEQGLHLSHLLRSALIWLPCGQDVF